MRFLFKAASRSAPPDSRSIQRKQLRLVALLGLILYVAGLYAIVEFPKHAMRTYLSENALSPNYANPQYSQTHAEAGLQFSARYAKFQAMSSITPVSDWTKNSADYIKKELREIGIEAYVGVFEGNNFVPAYYVFGVIRAPRASGADVVVVSTNFDSRSAIGLGETNSVGLVYSLAQMLKSAIYAPVHTEIEVVCEPAVKGKIYLSKDYVFLFTPQPYSSRALSSFLHSFHDGRWLPEFARGEIFAAINFNMPEASSKIDVPGSAGALPNLDLANAAARTLEGYRIAFRLQTELEAGSIWSRFFTTFLPLPLVRELKPYVSHESETLLNFMLTQARGVPNQAHGEFSRYSIEAITLTAIASRDHRDTRSVNVIIVAWYADFLHLFQGVLRCVNNLSEHFHQSFYFYLMTALDRFVPIGHYFIAFGLLLIGFFGYHTLVLLYATKATFVASLPPIILSHFFGALLFFAPRGLPTLMAILPPNASDTLNQSLSEEQQLLALGLVYSVLLHLVLLSLTPRRVPPSTPTTFRSLAVFPLTLFLATCSLVNFSFSYFAAAALIPILVLSNVPQSLRPLKLLQAVLVVPLNPFIFLALLSREDVRELIRTHLEIDVGTVSLVELVSLWNSNSFQLWPLISLLLFPLSVLQLRATLLTEDDSVLTVKPSEPLASPKSSKPASPSPSPDASAPFDSISGLSYSPFRDSVLRTRSRKLSPASNGPIPMMKVSDQSPSKASPPSTQLKPSPDSAPNMTLIPAISVNSTPTAMPSISVTETPHSPSGSNPQAKLKKTGLSIVSGRPSTPSIEPAKTDSKK